MVNISSLGEYAATVEQHAQGYDELTNDLHQAAGDEGELEYSLRYVKAAQDKMAEAERYDSEAARASGGDNGHGNDKEKAGNESQAAKYREKAELSREDGRGILNEAETHADKGLGMLNAAQSKAIEKRGQIGKTTNPPSSPTNNPFAQDALAYGASLPEQGIGTVIAPTVLALSGIRAAVSAEELYKPMSALNKAMTSAHDAAIPLSSTTAQSLHTYAAEIVGGGHGPGTGSYRPPALPANTGKETDRPEGGEIDDPLSLDDRIKAVLIEIVETLKFSDFLHRLRRHKPPSNLDDYELVAVTSPNESRNSLARAGHESHLPENVVSNYKRPGQMPFQDAGQSIAITSTNKDGVQEVRAIASAGIDLKDKPGALLITQIQSIGMTTVDASRQELRAALRNYSWQKTLVKAWEAAARKMGVREIVVQSAVNNKWYEINGKAVPEDRKIFYPDERLHVEREPAYANYDKVAADLGYTQDPKTKNWYKKLV